MNDFVITYLFRQSLTQPCDLYALLRVQFSQTHFKHLKEECIDSLA